MKQIALYHIETAVAANKTGWNITDTSSTDILPETVLP